MHRWNLLLFSLFIYTLAFSWADWKVLKTKHFEVFYKPDYEKEAKEILTISEYYRGDVTALTNHNVKKTSIVIEDIGTLSNGFADPIYKNIHIFTYPPNTSSELGSTENWWRAVTLHEYTHIAHLTKTGGLSSFLTKFLGTIFQPNIYSPGWLIEGVAVLSESQFSAYEGRLNDGYFDAYINARVKEKRFPSLLEMTYLPVEFPHYTGRYVYGGEFFKFLAEKYGTERLSHFFTHQSSSPFNILLGPIFPMFGIDDAARRAFGKSFPSLYNDWQAYQSQKAQNWKIDGEKLTTEKWRALYLTFYKDALYYVREKVEKTGAGKSFSFTKIMKLNLENQKKETIVSLTSSVSCPLRIKDNKLYYSVLEFKKGYANVLYNGFGVVSNLHRRNLKTGKDKIILKAGFRAFVVLDKDKILYAKDQKHTFGSEVWMYVPSNRKKKLLFKTSYLIGEITTDREHIIVSARKDWENWNLYFLDSETEQFTPIICTPFSESSICISGNKLLFANNYDGIYNIYAYDIKKEIFLQLTHSGYADYPALDPSHNNLYFIGLDSEGNNLYQKKADFGCEFLQKPYFKYPPPDLSLSESLIHKGNYGDVLKTLCPAVHIPIVLPADTTFTKWFSWIFLLGGDATGEHTYTIQFMNDPVELNTLLFLQYQSLFFYPFISYIELFYPDYGFLDISYPVFQKLEPGLSTLQFSVSGMVSEEDFSRKEITPWVFTGFRYPTFMVSALFSFPLERELWDSSVYRNGFRFAINTRKYIKCSEFNIYFQGVYDDPNDLPIIRGYESPLHTGKGGVASFEYSFPLLRIRKGLWNPNIYFEDVGITLFTDLAFAEEHPSQISGGIELQLETSALFLDALRLIPTLGISVNREKTVGIYLGLNINSPLIGNTQNLLYPQRNIFKNFFLTAK